VSVKLSNNLEDKKKILTTHFLHTSSSIYYLIHDFFLKLVYSPASYIDHSCLFLFFC